MNNSFPTYSGTSIISNINMKNIINEEREWNFFWYMSYGWRLLNLIPGFLEKAVNALVHEAEPCMVLLARCMGSLKLKKMIIVCLGYLHTESSGRRDSNWRIGNLSPLRFTKLVPKLVKRMIIHPTMNTISWILIFVAKSSPWIMSTSISSISSSTSITHSRALNTERNTRRKITSHKDTVNSRQYRRERRNCVTNKNLSSNLIV